MRVEKDDWTRSLYIFLKQVTLCFIVILVMQRAKSELCSETVSTELEWEEFSIWLISREQFSHAGDTFDDFCQRVSTKMSPEFKKRNVINIKRTPVSVWLFCHQDQPFLKMAVNVGGDCWNRNVCWWPVWSFLSTSILSPTSFCRQKTIYLLYISLASISKWLQSR